MASPAVHTVELQLLGVPSLRLSEQEVKLPPGKALGLVAYLALEGPTPRSRLASLLWSEFDEEGAREYLRQLLYKLRSNPIGTVLEASETEVRLKGKLQTDVKQFRELVGQGELEAALKLWRGVLLDGQEFAGATDFEDWLEYQREQLGHLRHSALEHLAQQHEAAAQYHPALQIHLGQLKEDPLHEHHHQSVIRLYGLLGERDTALAHFERCRKLLHQELGLEPLRETVEVAERIRNMTELAPAPTASPKDEALPLPGLVGREAAWSWLEAHRTGVALLLGEPGVGKTRLAEEFAGQYGNRLVLPAQELSLDTPLHPIAEGLRQAFDQGKLDGLDEIWKQEVARLIPQVSPQTMVWAQPAPEGRARFVQGLAHALVQAVGPGGCLIFDDLQWFDGLSLEVLTQVLRQKDLRSVATARPAELGENVAANSWLTALERQGQLHRYELEPWSEGDVARLIAQLSGASATLFSKRLHQATAGNAFFLLETLRTLFESGNLRSEPGIGWHTPFDDGTADYHELPVPQTVREAVLYRVDRLGGAARRLLEAASLAGDDFEPELLWSSTALAEWDGLEALERATSAGIIHAKSKGYEFAHDLVRRTLDDSLSPQRRKIIHRRLAASLEAADGAAGRIANHLEQAGLNHQAVPWRIKAAEAAQQVYAHHEALEHYHKALDDGASVQQAFEIRRQRVLLLGRINDTAGQEAELIALSSLAQTTQDPQMLARASQHWASFLSTLGRAAEAIHHAERGLSQPNLSPDLKTRLHTDAAMSHRILGQLSEAEAHLGAGLHTAEDNTRGILLALLAQCVALRGDFPQAREHLEVALKIFAAFPRNLCSALADYAETLLALGELQGALGALEQALALSRKFGFLRQERAILGTLGEVLIELGEINRAEQYLHEGLTLARNSPYPHRDAFVHFYWARACRFRGNLGKALDNLDTALQLLQGTEDIAYQVWVRCDLAELLTLLGNYGGARRVLEETGARLGATGPQKSPWVVQTLEIGWVRLELAEGHMEEAQQRLEQGTLAKEVPHYLHRLQRECFQAELGLRLNPSLRVGGIKAEILPRYKATLLGIQLRGLSSVSAELVDEATVLLGSGLVAAPEALVLRLALAQALAQTNPGRSFELHHQAQQSLEYMAQNLELSLRKSFVHRFIDAANQAPRRVL